MSLQTLTFDLSQEKVSALRDAATSNHLDLNAALNEAVDYYLEHDRQFRASVQEGLLQADAGDLIPHVDVVAHFQQWKLSRGVE